MSDSKRKVRYPAEPSSVAYITEGLDSFDLKQSTAGLIANESYSGCSIVFSAKKDIAEEKEYLLRVGQLPTMQAKAVWVKPLDEDLVRVGFEYLE